MAEKTQHLCKGSWSLFQIIGHLSLSQKRRLQVDFDKVPKAKLPMNTRHTSFSQDIGHLSLYQHTGHKLLYQNTGHTFLS